MVLKELDIEDALLVVGLIALVGGIAALNKPAAAIAFGIFCLYLWFEKRPRRPRKWDG